MSIINTDKLFFPETNFYSNFLYNYTFFLSVITFKHFKVLCYYSWCYSLESPIVFFISKIILLTFKYMYILYMLCVTYYT